MSDKNIRLPALVGAIMPVRLGQIHTIFSEGDFILRPILSHTDIIGVLHVYEDCFGRLPPIDPMRRALAKHRWLLVCLVEKDVAPIVGFMVFSVNSKRKRVRILRIGVIKQFRRQGLASAMLNDLMTHAKGYSIYAKVGERNLAALALFKKSGFESRLIRRPDKNEDTVLFFRRIPSSNEEESSNG